MKDYKQTNQLSHNDQQRGDFKKLLPIVKEALLQKVWLYNKFNGAWYSPEEFQAMYQEKEMNNHQVNSLMNNIVMRDPRGGNVAYHKAIDQKIQQHQKEITELKEKGEAFINKVIDYYQQKASNTRQ